MAARPAGLVTGIACGVGAALMWAAGFVAAKHGIAIGLTPFDIMFHRYVWAGFAFLPSVVSHGLRDLDGVGWGRGIALAVLGGPGLALVSASGFLLVPLGHGGVIQPSCAALAGMFLAAAVLKEPLPRARVYGALIIVMGLAVIGGEALATFGTHGLLGDLAFATAGVMFAFFGMLLRMWRIYPMRATAVVSVLTLAYIPVHTVLFGFGTMIRAGFAENALQAVAQGVFSGPTAIYLFARSVVLLGASRAAVFPSLVPGFTLLVGYLAIGEVPTLAQIAGFAIVLVGFRFTQKS
jgi:drug/metabolite transporter (DMT)-like permease